MTSRRLHVVIVDEELPYPANSGKRIRILNLVRQLAQRHRITLICHRNPQPGEAAAAEAHLQSLGVETLTVTPAGAARWAHAGRWAVPWKILLNSLKRVPYSVQWHTCPALQRAITDFAQAHQVDLWQCEWAPYARNILQCGVRPWVMMAHDIQTRIWERHLQAERNRWKRLFIKGQYRRYHRYEEQVFSSADQTITVTEPDAERATTEFGARRTAVVENGVDVGYYQSAAPAVSAVPRKSGRILFVGNLEWRPNADAARLLLDEVFPRVRSQVGSAELVIVGRRPPDWLCRRCRNVAGVELHADVPDVRPFFYQSGVLAVPLRFASGSRLKILEALATRLPVVSTRVGAEGLRLTPGQHYVSADDPEKMADTIVRWTHRPEEAEATARAGQEVVEQHYDWSVLADHMEAAWLELLRALDGSAVGSTPHAVALD
jgi:glycosyltransferase involved in cell wall biosynthesis